MSNRKSKGDRPTKRISDKIALIEFQPIKQIERLPYPCIFTIDEFRRSLRIAKASHIRNHYPKVAGQFRKDQPPVCPSRSARPGIMNQNNGAPLPTVMEVCAKLRDR